MSDIYKVITPENIELDFELAGIGSRFLAIAIDSFIQGVTLGGIYAILAFFNLFQLDSHISNLPTSFLGSIMIVSTLIIVFGYYIVLEIAMNGQTIGKRILNLRVRKEQGYAPNIWDILLRNIIRPIDLLPLFYAIGFITMFFDPRSKRLGDFAAGTIVVKETSRRKLIQFLNPNNPSFPSETVNASYNWLSTLIPFISQQDYLLMKNLLNRKNELNNFNILSHRLVHKIISQAATENFTWGMSDYAPDVLFFLINGYEKTHLI